MIRIITKATSWNIEFSDYAEALNWIENNSANFENQEIIALVDFHNLETKYIRAQLKMTFSDINE